MKIHKAKRKTTREERREAFHHNYTNDYYHTPKTFCGITDTYYQSDLRAEADALRYLKNSVKENNTKEIVKWAQSLAYWTKDREEATHYMTRAY